MVAHTDLMKQMTIENLFCTSPLSALLFLPNRFIVAAALTLIFLPTTETLLSRSSGLVLLSRAPVPFTITLSRLPYTPHSWPTLPLVQFTTPAVPFARLFVRLAYFLLALHRSHLFMISSHLIWST
jgi:hypothetical protein